MKNNEQEEPRGAEGGVGHMQVSIDHEAVQAAIQTRISASVERALGGWELSATIGKTITAEFADGAVGEAIREAIQSMDRQGLVKSLAAEMQRTITSAVVHVVEESVLTMVAKLRGLSDYGEDARKQRERLKAELFGREASRG